MVPEDIEFFIPAFGDGPLIRETVVSVLAQDDPVWRLTVIDDGGPLPGGSLQAWLVGLADSRIRYLSNAHRLGINRNFQRCADEATADWVFLLGADDRLLSDCLSRTRKIVTDRPSTAWIHTGAHIIDDRGRPAMPIADRMKKYSTPKVHGMREMAGEELATSLLGGNWMYFPSCAFRRDVLQHNGFRVGYDIVLDLDLYLRILLDGGTCLMLKDPGIEYRRHAASVSSSGADDGSRFAEEARYFEQIALVMLEAGWPRAASAARRHWTSRLHAVAKIPSLLGAGKPRAAASMVRVALSSALLAADQQVVDPVLLTGKHTDRKVRKGACAIRTGPDH